MGRNNEDFADGYKKGLFHGTSHEFQVGDTVEPRSRWNLPERAVAWATTSPERAARKGKNVYRVEPIADDVKHSVGTEGRDFYSRTGFKVIGNG
jgi:hypothetical protein